MTTDRDELDNRILAVARAVVAEGGPDALTVAAVASRAGVSRPTVYRRWPNRAALLFDVDLTNSVPDDFPDLGSFRVELTTALRFLRAHLASLDRELHAEQLALMVADGVFAEEVRRRRWIPDREAVMPLWRRGVERGELDPELDGEGFLDDVVSSAMFRVLFWHEPDDAWIEPYVERVCRGVLVRP